jgi:hypothetical protein
MWQQFNLTCTTLYGYENHVMIDYLADFIWSLCIGDMLNIIQAESVGVLHII